MAQLITVFWIGNVAGYRIRLSHGPLIFSYDFLVFVNLFKSQRVQSNPILDVSSQEHQSAATRSYSLSSCASVWAYCHRLHPLNDLQPICRVRIVLWHAIRLLKSPLARRCFQVRWGQLLQFYPTLPLFSSFISPFCNASLHSSSSAFFSETLSGKGRWNILHSRAVARCAQVCIYEALPITHRGNYSSLSHLHSRQ